MSDQGDPDEATKEEQTAYKKGIGSMGGHKRYLSALANNVPTFTDKDVLTGEEEINAEQLKTTLEERLVLIQRMFDDLLENPVTTEEDIVNFESFMGGVKSKLAKLKYTLQKGKSSPVSGLDQSVVSDKKATCDSAIKYPTLSLPTFSGGKNGCRDFRPYYQLFKELVENKEDIPAVYKVQYLRQSIPEGSEAWGVISHIPPVAENYDLMVGLLKSRYGNVEGEANRLRRNLMQVGNWQVCNSVEAQRRLIDHVRQNITLLEQVDEVETEDMTYLALHMLSVLPERLKFKVQKMEKERRTVDVIIDLIEKNIMSRLEVSSFSDHTKKPEKQYSQQPQKQPYNSSYLYHSSSNQSRSDTTRPCVYCAERGHSPHGCVKKSQEERAVIISQGRRCWNCLSDEHQNKNCTAPSRCNCGKRGRHSPSLCGAVPPWRYRGGRQNGGTSVRGIAEVASMVTAEGLGVTYLSTVELELPDKWNRPLKVRFLLDNAATHTYGVQKTIDKLPVTQREGTIDMAVSTFSGVRRLSARVVELQLPGNTSISLAVADHICEPLQGQPLDQSSIRELESYQLADKACVVGGPLPIDILVGVDNYWKLVTDKVVRLSSGVVIMSTLFGWVLSGEVASRRSMSHGGAYLAHALLVHGGWRESRQYGLNAQDSWYNPQAHALCAQDCQVSDPEDVEEVKCELEKFWDLDTLGIKPEREISPVLENFIHTLRQDPKTKRFRVSLPRRRNISNLPSNFNTSRTRLDGLQAKFRRPGNEDFAHKYQAVIEDQLQQGIIEKVVLSDAERKMLQENVSKPVSQFYIPHHGVQKSRSEKVRVVYDASAHAYKGALSLNDCLLKGPSLMNLLAEVLFTFRLHAVVLLADIEKAFLQIEVAEEDRDLLRFLWYDQEGNLEVFRFNRVPFGTGPSPFLLNATLRHHLENVVEDQALLQLLLRSLYVDDLLTGGETTEFVLKLRGLLEEILGQAAMKLHGWDSNSAEVREALGVVDQSDDNVVLGLLWNRVRDDMGINLEKLLKCKGGSTKRELLRATAQFYDPHGLLNPVVLIPKLLFCRVCRLKTHWDDLLPEDVSSEWIEWMSQLSLLEGVRWQRHALLPNHDRLELHGFSDASQLAYAAVVYIKSSRGEESECNLIMCKNRVSPQKKLSIPRLELMGALLLARLMAVVVAFLKHLKIDSIVYYSDSMNVLYWIRTEHRMWAVFVACRIKEINSLSNFVDWKWVKTDENPADLATRGLKPAELLNNQLWWHGPDFLRTGRSVPDVDSVHPPAVCLQERRKVVQAVVPVQVGVSSVIKCEEFSSLRRLLSRTVLYLRFVYWIAKKFSKDPGDRFEFSVLDLYAQARLLWIKSVQIEYYTEEVRFCRNHPARIPSGMKVPSSLMRQLALYLDPHGILRTGTRLQGAVIPECTKYPILLPKESHFTELLITDTHLRLCHSGVRQTMLSVRGLYWIPQCRRTIAKIVRSCVSCRKVTGDFYPVADPPPLPDFRVAKVETFENIGVDHCGPLYVREGRAKPQKCYVLILTCAVTRGVCLELVWDMSVHQFMLGFRRFVSSHGLPSYIMSDNSSTFECAGRELQAILNDPQFQKYLGNRNIRWDHYLEYSPHWGGWIERLNRVFKSAVRKVLSGVCVSFMELYTLLKEVEAVMNSRPISYVYDDVHEGQAITPSMLHCGRDLTQLPPNMFNFRFGRKHPQTCKDRLKYLEKVKTYFWTRWSREYLTELSERHAVTRKGKQVRQPRIDDIVLVKEGGSMSKIPRSRWPLGKIVLLHPGRDGVVRSVDVSLSVAKGAEPCVLRHRSPRQLVPLECDESEN